MTNKDMIEAAEECVQELRATDPDGLALRMMKAVVRDLNSGDPERTAYAAEFMEACISPDPDDIPRFLERHREEAQP